MPEPTRTDRPDNRRRPLMAGFRVTRAEMATIRDAARQSGLPVSEYLRSVVTAGGALPGT